MLLDRSVLDLKHLDELRNSVKLLCPKFVLLIKFNDFLESNFLEFNV